MQYRIFVLIYGNTYNIQIEKGLETHAKIYIQHMAKKERNF